MIRPARRDEAAALAVAHIQAWRETYTGLVPDDVVVESTQADRRSALWEERLASGQRSLFVVEGEHGLAGLACACPMDCVPADRDPIRGYDAYLEALYLTRNVKGLGFGRGLLQRIAQAVSERGMRSLALHVLVSNPSESFYQHAGAYFVRNEAVNPRTGRFQRAYAWDDVIGLRDRLASREAQVAQGDAEGT